MIVSGVRPYYAHLAHSRVDDKEQLVQLKPWCRVSVKEYTSEFYPVLVFARLPSQIWAHQVNDVLSFCE